MPANSSTPDNAPPITVLVVEPDILVRMVIADYLRDCGYKVLEAVAVDDALAVLASGQQIDVIFTEVQLSSSMSGFGLAHWVRANHPSIDVILTSGVNGAAEKAGDLCDDGPLEKPYHPQEFVRRINLLRERRRTTPKA